MLDNLIIYVPCEKQNIYQTCKILTDFKKLKLKI